MPRRTYTTKADYDGEWSVKVEHEGARGRPPLKLHYNRAAVIGGISRPRAEMLERLIGWPHGHRIVIIGGGFGWLAEALEERGYTNVLSVDTSPYIQAHKVLPETQDIDDAVEENKAVLQDLVDRGKIPPERAKPINATEKAQLIARFADSQPRSRATRGVIDEDVSNNGARNRIRNQLGGTVDAVVSEGVVEALEDSEVLDLSSDMNALAGDVVHLITPRHDDLLARGDQDPVLNWHTLEEYKALVPGDRWIDVEGKGRLL